MAHHTCDYLIIGNSAAGVTAAEFLSAAAPDKSIIMVSHEPYRCYGRPLISYLLEGKTDREHLDYKSANFYEKRGIETLFGAEFEAVAIDAFAHEVKLAGGRRDFLREVPARYGLRPLHSPYCRHGGPHERAYVHYAR